MQLGDARQFSFNLMGCLQALTVVVFLMTKISSFDAKDLGS